VTQNIRSVSIGEIVASNADEDVLVAYGVGSCVAICLYDSAARVGGMLHALLPTAPDGTKTPTSSKFVDQGVPLLIDALVKLGARRYRLAAQLCGGAQVLSAPGFENSLNIGERNVEAAKTALHKAGIRIHGQAIGGDVGRTVKFYIADGRATLRSLRHGDQPIGDHQKTKSKDDKERLQYATQNV
jgi:chemotaxis protein CheD